jgi:hypothetical protein
LKLVEPTHLGRGQHLVGLVGRACAEFGLGGGQRANAAPSGIRRQLDGSLQEGGRRGWAPAGLRAISCVLQLLGHGLIRLGDRVGAMPRATVGVRRRSSHLGQRSVRRASIARGRRPVDG